MTDLKSLHKQLQQYGPVSSTLSKLIRPAVQAKEGHILVWGDYSSIEARVNPWLANSHAAEHQVLDLYRAGEDLYITNAKDIFNVTEIDLTTAEGKYQRSAGKVAVLALGFLGGQGALRIMARGYGLRLSDDESNSIIAGWRSRNTWARAFGNIAFDAFHKLAQSRQGGLRIEAGLLDFEFAPDLLGGSILCWLPSGRPLVYPDVKCGMVRDKDTDEESYAVTYTHGFGRSRMWAGKCIQGPTQGCAADLLREFTVRTDPWDCVVLHTHDEVILEVPEEEGGEWKERLHEEMILNLPWMDSLPVEAEITMDHYYHK